MNFSAGEAKEIIEGEEKDPIWSSKKEEIRR
jgi:hypothetical protein